MVTANIAAEPPLPPEQTEADLADLYPSVSLAYEFSRPSYDWVTKRLEAVDGRIQTLLTFAASFTVGAPVLVSAVLPGKSLHSPWLGAAFFLFVALVAVGFYARASGDITVVSPKLLYDGWLWRSEWQFKKDMLFWLGEQFEKNRDLVNWKGTLGNIATGLFIVEIGCILVWMLLG